MTNFSSSCCRFAITALTLLAGSAFAGAPIAEGDARHVQNHPDVVAAYLGTGA